MHHSAQGAIKEKAWHCALHAPCCPESVPCLAKEGHVSGDEAEGGPLECRDLQTGGLGGPPGRSPAGAQRVRLAAEASRGTASLKPTDSMIADGRCSAQCM